MGGGKIDKLMIYQWPEQAEEDRQSQTPEVLMAKIQALGR